MQLTTCEARLSFASFCGLRIPGAFRDRADARIRSRACLPAGGRAARSSIVLWPFGGIAFVSPPPRPGAHALEHRGRPAGECRAGAGAGGASAVSLATAVWRYSAPDAYRLIVLDSHGSICSCSSSICCRFIRSMAAKFCARCFGFRSVESGACRSRASSGLLGGALLGALCDSR